MNEIKPYAIFLDGPHYVGKSTLAKTLANLNDAFYHISTGEYLERYKNSDHPNIKQYVPIIKSIDQGKYIPNKEMNEILKYMIQESIQSRGLNTKKQFPIIDGYPRTFDQLEYVIKVFKPVAQVEVYYDEDKSVEEKHFLNLAKKRYDEFGLDKDLPESAQLRLENYRKNAAGMSNLMIQKGIIKPQAYFKIKNDGDLADLEVQATYLIRKFENLGLFKLLK